MKVVILNGPMGVGKTTVGKYIADRHPGTALIDGDWCMDLHPFVGSRETKAMAVDNILHMIGNYRNCSVCSMVVLVWLMDDPWVVQSITEGLAALQAEVKYVTLVCDRENLISRWNHDRNCDWRTDDWLKVSLKSLPAFASMENALDTSNLSVDRVADLVMQTGEDKVLLRFVTEDDLSEVARTWPSDHRPIPEEEARGVISYLRDSYAKNTQGCVFHLCLAVCRAEDPRTFMGWCGLDGRQTPAEPEIFILLDEEYRRKGYGTQCVKELLRMAAEEYGLSGVHGGCDKENIASRRAMEKGGMVQYGTEDNGDPLFRFTVKEKD